MNEGRKEGIKEDERRKMKAGRKEVRGKRKKRKMKE